MFDDLSVQDEINMSTCLALQFQTIKFKSIYHTRALSAAYVDLSLQNETRKQTINLCHAAYQSKPIKQEASSTLQPYVHTNKVKSKSNQFITQEPRSFALDAKMPMMTNKSICHHNIDTSNAYADLSLQN